MGKQIYVRNLAGEVTNDDLLDLFGQYGKVLTSQVISNRENGHAGGFGVVEMENDQEAENAIRGLNGTMHNNLALAVNLATTGGEGAPCGNDSASGASVPRFSIGNGSCSGAGYAGEKLPPEFLEWARQQYSEEEILAGIREVRETGGSELKDFIQEIEEILAPNA